MFVHHIATDWRRGGQRPLDEALCAYAEKLTAAPQTMTDEDVALLRRHGLDDRAIHDAIQIIAYFNYINRVADALDVAQEDFVRPWEQAPETWQEGSRT